MEKIIEAGHYYSVNGPTQLSIKGWEIGRNLKEELPDAGLVLFVDDYHEVQTVLEDNDQFLEPDKAKAAISQMHVEAEHVYSEAEIALSAPAKMAALLENGLVKLKNGVLSTDGVRLGCLRRYHNKLLKSYMRLFRLSVAQSKS